MRGAPLRIVQISDTHLFGDPARELLGVNTQSSFESLLSILHTEKPEMILLTGDLSQDGSADSYLRLADAMNLFQVPIYCIPGNHDDSIAMAKIYPRGHVSVQRQILVPGWQIIMLDSQKVGSVEGYLSQEQLTFLQHCLESKPELRAIIVMHHQPIAVGSTWLDKIGVTNASAFWDLISHYSNANTILFGHVHQLFEGEKNGVKLFSSPSTCIQFKTHSDKFALEKLAPAYRWLDLYSNGEIKTGVCRAPEYVGDFLVEAKGY
jgi:Icc protein